MKPIHEMIVLVEPDCLSCVRALETANVLRQRGVVANLIVINRIDDPDSCRKFGVVIFPAVYINGRLAFYGEFSVEDAQRFAQDSVHN
ncbi:MAG: thioredoxin family protein [Ignavibacteriae bacterium]|nr:thioredoxin family protein [Ignavibacteria bacterium]MBI3365814.1 thioredoxin family protein [Ignavibacteriota bacterium]